MILGNRDGLLKKETMGSRICCALSVINLHGNKTNLGKSASCRTIHMQLKKPPLCYTAKRYHSGAH